MNIRDMVYIGGQVQPEARTKFAAVAKAAGLTVAGLIRHMVHRAVEDAPHVLPSTGAAQKLTLRLSDAARLRLREEATAYGATPTAWARTMLEAQLLRGPGWSPAQMTELRAMRILLADIRDGETAEAAERVAAALALLDAAILGNLTYWSVTGPSEAVTDDQGVAAVSHDGALLPP